MQDWWSNLTTYISLSLSLRRHTLYLLYDNVLEINVGTKLPKPQLDNQQVKYNYLIN